ncbi:MAG: Uma2 family endonuclease [Anaerolineae bacterium]|nr:Uma2 family endonuclease [Anaerolineae bacterium]
MVVQERSITAEDFEAYALLPENVHRRLELVDGRMIELVSNDSSSRIGMLMGSRLTLFVYEHKLGWTTGADGGYQVGDDRFIPDAAFISNKRQAAPSGKAYNPIPLDLAVEVLSPTDDMSEVRIKLFKYVRAGFTVWLVDPVTQHIEVYSPDHDPRTIGIDGVLEGGDMLPGFTLPVKDIFGL